MRSRWLTASGLVLALVVAFFLALAERGAAAPKRSRHASITAELDCSACHTTDSWKKLSASAGAGANFDHSRTGFPLTQRHVLVSCVECHQPERPITRECKGCHEDPHQGQLGSGCDDCHSAASWRVTEAFAQHRKTRLPLTGMHALIECRDCHQRTDEREFTTVPADCYACHADDYRRPDMHPTHVGVPGDPNQPPFPRDCAQCHRASGWSPAFTRNPLVTGVQAFGQALSASEHDRMFVLSFGPHRGAECRSCHMSAAAPRAVRCNGCHAHDEVRSRQQHERIAGFSMTACLACHPGGRR